MAFSASSNSRNAFFAASPATTSPPPAAYAAVVIRAYPFWARLAALSVSSMRPAVAFSDRFALTSDACAVFVSALIKMLRTDCGGRH